MLPSKNSKKLLMKISKKPITNSQQFGVSFSLKQCRNFKLAWHSVLGALISDLGVRRFRLMSYWDEHERSPGEYDFSQLDAQVAMISDAGGFISLCLGVRQPRWPENHWPDWAWNLPKPERDTALLKFIEAVVTRYKDNAAIISYQLENEALLESFGTRSEVDRKRLRAEYKLVKQLDPTKPIIMTTSTSWGIPIRQPRPDIIGFSYYQIIFNKMYRLSFHRPWLDRFRGRLLRILYRKPSFIHELQAEPWGPKNIWEMPAEEQEKSMGLEQFRTNIKHARKTKLSPIDLWGAEWWYWNKMVHSRPTYWETARKLFIKQP